MKDQEFIELLNLYLDHEISVADAARLEAEVQRDAARYRVYREYCQMHKACALLSPAYFGEAPVAADFASNARKWTNPFAIGGLIAAAACLTFVFLNRTTTAVPAETSAVAESSRPAASVPADRNFGQTVTVSVRQPDRQSTLLTQSLRWNTNELPTVSVQDVRLNWIEGIQLSSVPQVPADSLRFETQPAPKGDAQRTFDPGSLLVPTEYNALQFGK